MEWIWLKFFSPSISCVGERKTITNNFFVDFFNFSFFFRRIENPNIFSWKEKHLWTLLKFYSSDIWARPWNWHSAIYSCYRRGTLFNSLLKIFKQPPQNKWKSQFIRCCRCRKHYFCVLNFVFPFLFLCCDF